MRVILSVKSVVPPLTGIGRYAVELARRLPDIEGIEELRLMRGAHEVSDVSALVAPDSQPPWIRYKRWIPFKSLARQMYFLGNGFQTARAWKKFSDRYVLHEPAYLLDPFDGPAVATIHDLSHIHFPDFHPKDRVKLMNRELPRTLDKATHLITVSEFVRREVITMLGVPSDKVTAVLHGVDARFKPKSAEQTFATRRKYRLDTKPYLLVVATLEPRKNLMRLLSAYDDLPAALRDRYPLVLIGAQGWRNESLNKQLERMVANGSVRKLGYVGDEDLPDLYAGAYAFAYPSIYEGFGLPILEAMACGIPVIASNCSSMPEVQGEAGIKVNPFDVSSIREGLVRLLEDEIFRLTAIEAGLQRVQYFTWERCMRETTAVYAKVAC